MNKFRLPKCDTLQAKSAGRKCVLCCCAFVLFISCGENPSYTSPQGYDFSNPEKRILSDNLLEISGITFLPNIQDSILAVNDEEGKIFLVPLKKAKARTFKFSKSGDYEDIAVYQQSIFVLQSNGKIFSFDKQLSGEKMQSKEWELNLPSGDYESIFADEREDRFYVLCKTCKKIQGDSVLGFSFSFQYDSAFTSFEPFAIRQDTSKFWPKKRFMPSALAKNRMNDEWFIISAANKLLMITDNTWKIKDVYRLDPGVFYHPEGIAFDENSNLYISNEGDESHNANILKFERIP